MVPTSDLTRVHDVFGECQRRYPTIQMGFEAYLARLDEIIQSLGENAPGSDPPKEGDWIQAFGRLHHADLFLATACAGGDRIAWEYFVDDYEPLVRKLASQACGNVSDGEDLSQEILLSLLGRPSGVVPAEGERENPSRLRGYNGRGSLAAWLRVMIAHAAIDRFRRAKKQVPIDDLEQQSSLPESLVDSEAVDEKNAGLDARWGPVLSRLLKEELQRLPPRDRLMLNLYYLQGTPLRLIGEHFGVHEATASRWLEALRKGIRKRVERELKTQHGLQARDLKSIWMWISEEENLPLEKLLAE